MRSHKQLYDYFLFLMIHIPITTSINKKLEEKKSPFVVVSFKNNNPHIRFPTATSVEAFLPRSLRIPLLSYLFLSIIQRKRKKFLFFIFQLSFKTDIFNLSIPTRPSSLFLKVNIPIFIYTYIYFEFAI